MGEREIHGEVLEKQNARQIYEDEKSRGNEAGLAEKNDFYTFEFKIHPVPPMMKPKFDFYTTSPSTSTPGSVAIFIHWKTAAPMTSV